MDPDFWNDPKKAESILKVIKLSKKWISSFRALEEKINDLEVMQEFFQDGEVSEEELDAQYAAVVEVFEDVESGGKFNREELQVKAIG